MVGEVKKIKKTLGNIKNKICDHSLYGTHLIIFFLIVFVIKTGIVYFSNKNLDPIKSCLSSMSTDIMVLFIVQFIITINFFVKTLILRLFNNIIVFVMLLIYCIDIFTIFFFQSRVSVREAYIMGNNGGTGFSMVAIAWILSFIIIGIISIIFVNLIGGKEKNLKKKMVLILSIVSLCYADFYGTLIIFNINTYYVENIFGLNLYNIPEIQEISDNQLSYKNYISTIQGSGNDLNIILMFAESLSAVDSANLGGKDNMPNFDKIQKDGITFTNFITNGTTSDTAHISTLYGVIPLINIRSNNTPYSGYKLLMQPLPKYLNGQGYNTEFISAASLDFLDQRDFLSGAGFQKIIGEEAFTGHKFTFESAPDGNLYDKVIEEVQNQTGKYFIGLQTISFHKPYNTPKGRTESLALQYSDEELYRFYLKLQEIGFFDNGILVILGDHRKMNPAEEGERELFGKNRYTKSVATVVGSGINSGTINSNIIQHTDFYNSLKRLVGHGVVKIDKTYNDIFSANTQRNRGITNAEFYEINRYTVSSTDEEPFLFRNISNLSGKNNEVYNYFSSYLGFEFGNNKEYGIDEVDDGIKLIGHRGSIEDAAENTIQSFLSAKEKGAIGIEFDVSYTKDKHNVVVHGNELYASNCEKLKVGNYTLDWIVKNCTIINGEKYRTLNDVLETIDGLFDYYFLEIKVYDESLGEEQTRDAIQTVRDLNMLDRVIFISYSDSAREILNSQTDVIFGWDTFDVNDLNFIGDNNSKYFLAPFDILTPEIVEKVKTLGKEVVTYTINDVKTYQTVKDLGIHFIMTDKLSLLQEYDNSKYYPLKHSLKNVNLQKSSR